MPDEQHLRKSLNDLHTELQQTEQVDASTTELLMTLTKDIESLLDREGLSEADRDQIESMRERLQDLAYGFEEKHPRMMSAIKILTDGLGNWGI